MLNGLCFLNMASVLGHEAVHVNSTARSIYSSCAPVFLIKWKRSTLHLPLYRKKFVPRRLSCNYNRIFNASSTRSNVNSLFGKIATLFNRWYTIEFFLEIFFLRQLIPGSCSKSICGKFGIS